jgi:hypothetical protein
MLTYADVSSTQVCASEDSICVWQYSSKVAKLTSIEGKSAEVALKKKDGKEVVWHVDDSPSTSSTSGAEHLKSQKRAATQVFFFTRYVSAFYFVEHDRA